jgi:hypothetical protein
VVKGEIHAPELINVLLPMSVVTVTYVVNQIIVQAATLAKVVLTPVNSRIHVRVQVGILAKVTIIVLLRILVEQIRAIMAISAKQIILVVPILAMVAILLQEVAHMVQDKLDLLRIVIIVSAQN